MYVSTEVARDALHATGRYDVIAGIISPVSDGYEKEVRYIMIYTVHVAGPDSLQF